MTGVGRPPQRQDASGPGRVNNDRVVRLRDKRGALDRRGRDEGWEVTTAIRRVGGTEGEWLRRELAGVVRELLAWAREDMTARSHQHGDEEQAA